MANITCLVANPTDSDVTINAHTAKAKSITKLVFAEADALAWVQTNHMTLIPVGTYSRGQYRRRLKKLVGYSDLAV